jgi:hypothetical protein
LQETGQLIGSPPSKIYYHIKLLEKHGVLMVAKTRLISNIVENLFQTTAKCIKVDPALLYTPTQEGSDSIDKVISDFFDEAKEDA